KLLRVLEDRRVMRVGGRAAREVDVRFVAATNADLESGANGFRPDLFFRLSGITLTIPPLRERREEVAPLAARFVATACEQLGGRPRPTISRAALDVLERH